MTNKAIPSGAAAAKGASKTTAGKTAKGPQKLDDKQLGKAAGAGWFDDAIDWVGDNVAAPVVDTVTSGADWVADVATDGAEWVQKGGLEDVLDKAGTFVNQVGTFVVDGVAIPLKDIVSDPGSKIGGALEDMFEPIGDGLGDFFQGDFDDALNNFEKGFGHFDDGFVDIFEALEESIDGVTDIAADALQVVSRLTGDVGNFVLSEIVAEGFDMIGWEDAKNFSQTAGTLVENTFDVIAEKGTMTLEMAVNIQTMFIDGDALKVIGALGKSFGEFAQGDLSASWNELKGSGIDTWATQNLKSYGEGCAALIDIVKEAGKNGGDLLGDVYKIYNNLATEVATKALSGVGLDAASAKLQQFSAGLNDLIEKMDDTLGEKGAMHAGPFGKLQMFGAVCASAAQLCAGDPAKAGQIFLERSGAAEALDTGAKGLALINDIAENPQVRDVLTSIADKGASTVAEAKTMVADAKFSLQMGINMSESMAADIQNKIAVAQEEITSRLEAIDTEIAKLEQSRVSLVSLAAITPSDPSYAQGVRDCDAKIDAFERQSAEIAAVGLVAVSSIVSEVADTKQITDNMAKDGHPAAQYYAQA